MTSLSTNLLKEEIGGIYFIFLDIISLYGPYYWRYDLLIKSSLRFLWVRVGSKGSVHMGVRGIWSSSLRFFAVGINFICEREDFLLSNKILLFFVGNGGKLGWVIKVCDWVYFYLNMTLTILQFTLLLQLFMDTIYLLWWLVRFYLFLKVVFVFVDQQLSIYGVIMNAFPYKIK